MKFFIIFFIAAQMLSAQFKIQSDSPAPIYPSSMNQTEVLITNNGTGFFFASANTMTFTPSFFISEGVYMSSNTGISWYGSDTCNAGNLNFHGGDPAVAMTANNTLVLTRNGRSPFIGLFSNLSTDYGITWTTGPTITTMELERAATAADNAELSPFRGRVYSIWSRLTTPRNVYIAWSTDNGTTWSEPARINNTTARCEGGDIAIGPNGEVYVTWATVTNTSPFYETGAGFARSTDGGATWFVQETAFPMYGIKGQLTQKQNIRVNSQPKIAVDNSYNPLTRGNVYITASQKILAPAGSDPDIILWYSTNKGTDWSAPIRVNKDSLNNGKTQYFPAIAVDYHGYGYILYYDDRETTEDSTAVFMTIFNGSNVEQREDYNVSGHNFKPIPIGGLGQGYQGDNIGISTMLGVTVMPLWMDNSTGNYQIWGNRIVILRDAVTDALPPNSFTVHGNYPNPFNSSTTVRISLPSPDEITFSVYTATGQEVFQFSKNFTSAGEHSIALHTGAYALASGVYFLKVSNKSSSTMLPIVYLK